MKPYRNKRAFAFLAVIVFLTLPFHINASQQAAPGTVRILLKELDKASRIDIGIFGSYLMNDQLSFQSGSELKVIANNNKIMVYYEGAIVQSKQSLILVRYGQTKENENGLRINSKLNLLEGDLHISLSENGLRAILHIGIEDYLKGVVPYEMSDSFPIEALKAQAIAARSYAVRGLRNDRDYDLTDDTNDQVFKGYNKEYQQALLAVQETTGKVLTFENQVARTYYTASNGGQTEASSNAWAYEPTAYSGVWDDHYDEQNPQSVVRTFSIPRIWDADTPGKTNLENLLKGLVADRIAPSGYDNNPSYIEIEEFKDISAITPKFQNGSRLMTQLEITLSVSARRKIQLEQEKEISLFTVEAIRPSPAFTSPPEQAWGLVETIPKPIKLIVDIFPQIEQILGLSINLKENEIIQIMPDEDAFIIRSSRYGHGVGMSQRGAEWMAKQYNKNSSEILAFYYPGTLQEAYLTIPESRPSLGLEYLTTPGPIPTATPRPTLVPQSAAAESGQWKVIITEISPNSSLNLRILPSITSDVISQLYYGQYLLVLERVGEEWLHVQADGIQGYVMESFVQRVP